MAVITARSAIPMTTEGVSAAAMSGGIQGQKRERQGPDEGQYSVHNLRPVGLG